MNTLCLASGSISRKSVLEGASIRFNAHSSDIEEIYQGESPQDYVTRLAEQKARAVSSKVAEDVIIAADSVVVLDDEIIEKPKDYDDAVRILTNLQGKTHTFHTGMCVYDVVIDKIIITHTITQVTFTQISKDSIKKYVTRFKPYRFAGGYDNAISSWFIERIEGSQTNLMGLPMPVLKQSLEQLGYDWFDFIK